MLIDLTHTIVPDMPMAPGSEPLALAVTGSLTRTGSRDTLLTLPSHTGTHMDAPAHLLREGSSLDVLPVSQFCGRAVVLDVTDLTGAAITADWLRAQNGLLHTADFVLFYTGWETRWGSGAYFAPGFSVPDEEGARYLVSCGLKGVGTDAWSVDAPDRPDRPVHRALLGGGLVILESLCLRKVAPRQAFQLIALPLKFENADGAPVRAVADFRDTSGKEMDQP